MLQLHQKEKYWRGKLIMYFVISFLISTSFAFQTSSLPFTSGLLSCSLWLRYGVLINENTIIFVNAVGVFLFTLYCISYYIFTINKRRMGHQLLLVFLMITFSIVYSKFEPDDLQASRLIGNFLSQLFLSFNHVVCNP